MFCFGYLFTLILMPISAYYLNYNVSSETYFIIIIGILLFSFVSQFAKYIICYQKKVVIQKLKPLYLSKLSYVFMLALALFTFFYLFSFFISNVDFSYSLANISKDINNFRNMLVSKVDRLEYPFLLSQGLKISKCLAFISLYIYFNNSVYYKKYIKNFYLLLPTIIFCLMEFITGARFAILEFIIASFFLFIFFNSANNTKFKLNQRNIIKLIFFMIILIVIFDLSRYVVDTSQDDSILEILAFYFGNPIILLDIYINNFNGVHTNFFGEETFYAIYSFLNKINIVDYSNSVHLEFRSYNGINLGNVYTGYRSLINDFGFIGMLIMHIIYALLINCFYYSIVYKKRKPIDIFIVFYLYLSSMTVMHFFNGRFFYIFSPGFLSVFIIICIFSKVLYVKYID
ncbi:MAG: oligosaccharide repeat unit polymerase [Campylobacter sp.]|nr:oligosaccharide repeat unit polymerase [Campylobacter sp.]